jgi:hypothetical protein
MSVKIFLKEECRLIKLRKNSLGRYLDLRGIKKIVEKITQLELYKCNSSFNVDRLIKWRLILYAKCEVRVLERRNSCRNLVR